MGTCVKHKSEEEVVKVWNTDKLDEAIGLFPKECVYMRWKYEDATTPAHRRLLEWYHDKGLKVMGRRLLLPVTRLLCRVGIPVRNT